MFLKSCRRRENYNNVGPIYLIDTDNVWMLLFVPLSYISFGKMDRSTGKESRLTSSLAYLPTTYCIRTNQAK